MAPLTWREVSAPSFSGVSEAQARAAQLMSNGFDSAINALDRMKTSQNQGASSEMARRIAAYGGDYSALNRDLQNGTILSGINGTVDPEMFKWAGTREGVALANDGSRLANAGTAEQNRHRAWDNNRVEGYEANRPAANDVIGQINYLAGLGTPEAYAEAQKLARDNTPTLSAAGMTIADVEGVFTNNRAHVQDGAATNANLASSEEQKAAIARQQEADRIYADLVGGQVDPREAMRALDSSGLDPKVAELVRGKIASPEGQAAWGQPISADQFLIEQQLHEQRNGGGPVPGGISPVSRMLDGATGPGGGDGYGNTAAVIRHFEGFREEPYWDVNAYRTGYGSDTITRPDGSVVRVTQGMTVSREDAERDLERRVNQEFVPGIVKKVGAENWGRLPSQAQAALTSIAYNYGSLPFSVASAVTTGDVNQIAAAVEGLKGHNDGVNAKRRQQEADMIRGTAGIPTGSTGGDLAASAASGLQDSVRSAYDRATSKTGPLTATENRALVTYSNQQGKQVQSILDTVTADNMFNNTGSLLATLQDPSHATSTPTDAASALKEKLSDEMDLDQADLTQKIGEMSAKYGMTAGVSAAIIEHSIRENGIFARILQGRTDIRDSEIEEYIAQLYNPEGRTAEEKLQPLTARVNAENARREIVDALQSGHAQVKQAEQDYFAAAERAKGNANLQSKVEERRQILQMLQENLDRAISGAGQSAIITAHTNGKR